MHRITIVVAIAASGCVTHHTSKVGPFVKNIVARPQGLAVDSCVVQLETTKDYTWWWDRGQAEVDHGVSEGSCWRTFVPMGGLQ